VEMKKIGKEGRKRIKGMSARIFMYLCRLLFSLSFSRFITRPQTACGVALSSSSSWSSMSLDGQTRIDHIHHVLFDVRDGAGGGGCAPRDQKEVYFPAMPSIPDFVPKATKPTSKVVDHAPRDPYLYPELKTEVGSSKFDQPTLQVLATHLVVRD